MNSVKQELKNWLFILVSLAAGIGLFLLWKTFAVPTLSTAFLIDGGAVDQIQNLLYIVGVLALLVLALIIWVVKITVDVSKLKKEAVESSI